MLLDSSWKPAADSRLQPKTTVAIHSFMARCDLGCREPVTSARAPHPNRYHEVSQDFSDELV